MGHPTPFRGPPFKGVMGAASLAFWLGLVLFVPFASALTAGETASLQALQTHWPMLPWKQADFQVASQACQLQGILCEKEHVVAIDFESMGLTGTIPEAIFNLPYLRSLNLMRNELTGSALVSRWLELHVLLLGENQLDLCSSTPLPNTHYEGCSIFPQRGLDITVECQKKYESIGCGPQSVIATSATVRRAAVQNAFDFSARNFKYSLGGLVVFVIVSVFVVLKCAICGGGEKDSTNAADGPIAADANAVAMTETGGSPDAVEDSSQSYEGIPPPKSEVPDFANIVKTSESGGLLYLDLTPANKSLPSPLTTAHLSKLFTFFDANTHSISAVRLNNQDLTGVDDAGIALLTSFIATVKSVNLTHAKLSPTFMESLISALEHVHITEDVVLDAPLSDDLRSAFLSSAIFFKSLTLASKNIDLIPAYIEQCVNLEKIDIQCSETPSNEKFESLAQALRVNTSLSYASFKYPSPTAGLSVLELAVILRDNSTLKMLEISVVVTATDPLEILEQESRLLLALQQNQTTRVIVPDNYLIQQDQDGVLLQLSASNTDGPITHTMLPNSWPIQKRSLVVILFAISSRNQAITAQKPPKKAESAQLATIPVATSVETARYLKTKEIVDKIDQLEASHHST